MSHFSSTARTSLAKGLGIALVVALGLGLAPSHAAQADPVSDLRSRAQEVSAQMTDLQNQIRSATTEVEEARYRGSQLDEEIAASEAKLAEARTAEDRSRKELSSYAVQAYVSGGSDDGVAALIGADGSTLDQRQGYVTSAVGDRQQLVDQLEAAQRVTKDQADELRSTRAESEAVLARAESKQKQAQDAAERLATIKAQLDGELATAVAEQQAAEQRAAEERARAEAERQARAEAQRAAAAQRAATPAPLPPVSSAPAPAASSGGGGGSSSGGGGGGTSSGGGGFVAPPNSSAAAIAIAAAQSQLGVPYSWGGGNASGPSYGIAQGANIRGFDCSGLTLYAYAQAGITLSHLTWSQMRQGRVVPLSQIQPGDLVFYWGGGHMALYVGNGQVIHAPRTGDVVRYGSLYMGTPEKVVRPTG